MSQLNPLGPLDFDYERFPGVALRATEKALKGHAMADRPEQVGELLLRMGRVTKHIISVLKSDLLSAATKSAVEPELKSLEAGVVVLEQLQQQPLALANSVPSKPAVQEQVDAAGSVLTALLNLLLFLLDEGQSPTGLNWYRELFEKGGVGKIPTPQAVIDFLDLSRRNQVFASWWVQGNNPLCVQGVRLEDLKKVGIDLDASMYELVMPGDTLTAADKDNRLFWVDFQDLLADLEPGDFPVSKRLPKPRVVFAVKPARPNDEPFVALAIQESGGGALVWSDEANPKTRNDWTRAMLASLCANQLHHTFVSHFPRTHFVMEGVAVATLRKLEKNHPLFWLLRAHIDGTLAFNETALSSFTDQGGADRFLMASSLRTGQSLMCKSLDEWHKFDFPTDLVDRQVGLAQLPYYPYRDDVQLWWDAIEGLVHEVVDGTYPDDAAVRGDTQLQEWGGVLAGKRIPQANGAGLIPTPPGDKAELGALLQKIIFTCTAYHAAVQIPLNGFDVSPLTAPCSLYPDDPADPPESMMANLGTSLFQLAFFFFGDVVTHRAGNYVVRWGRIRIPNNMKNPVRTFANSLPNIKARIDGANSTTRRTIGAFTSLLPENVSRSVDI